ncbi:peptidoglycan editing factor PgeF [Acidobacteriota bacterium]
MAIDRKDYLTVPKLEETPFIVHGFGTKHWAESDFKRTPELARFECLSIKQTHSDIVRVIRAIPDRLLEGDAMITDLQGLLLIIKTADCLPVFLVDREGKTIAAVHSGWKGTKKRVLQKTVEAMTSNFGSAPESMLVAMGPCIVSSCYEVSEVVLTEFMQTGFPRDVFQNHPKGKNKYLLDLNKANRTQLTETGVLEENIVSVDLCTHCDDSLLSYRRDRKTAQRLINFIGLMLQ